MSFYLYTANYTADAVKGLIKELDLLPVCFGAFFGSFLVVITYSLGLQLRLSSGFLAES